ncbi:HIRAN domain-containing protein [Salinibacterium sp. SWN248]|uniref:HIRAN domain-containing protein n=1 Tax=Salinibacterium sp. SWN248 TaxID=2792056 RepID=UPI0018CFD707|nr:HIRAN domain-containing protein [Salinibacterium sp. SWN248]MBH0023976.1 hypothetical protein [Salinibacterium sp. SWN248]
MVDQTEALRVVGDEYFASPFKKAGLDGKTVQARLVRDPNNRHDRNAVGVHVGKHQVGFLSSTRAQKVAKWIDAAGGVFETTLTHRGGGADVLVPAEWVYVPRKGRINVQQTTKHQEALAELGVGSHKCKVVRNGEHIHVEVGGVLIGKLYPNQLDEATLQRVDHNRQQDLLVAESDHRKGLYATIITPAPKAPRPPTLHVPLPATAPAEPAPPTATGSPAAPVLGIKGFIKSLFGK